VHYAYYSRYDIAADDVHKAVTADRDGAQTDYWAHLGPTSDRGGPHFADLIDQIRRVQDGVVAARLPADAAAQLVAQLAEVADVLAAHEVAALEAPAGARLDLPGRGHPFVPPHVVDKRTGSEVRAHVTFTRYFLGGNGAATGGAHAVLFNEILGRLSIGSGRPLSRTANYRHITIGRRLDIEAALDRIEGRTIHLRTVARRRGRCRGVPRVCSSSCCRASHSHVGGVQASPWSNGPQRQQDFWREPSND
jgi:hypothetical protein